MSAPTRSVLLITLALAMTLLSSLAGATPSQMNYQGQLRSSGALFTGTAGMKFAIVDGSTWLWSNDSTGSASVQPTGSVSVPVSGGVFTVMLGASPMKPLGPAVFLSASAPALRVWVSTGGAYEQLTDQALASVPFALQGGAGAGAWSTNGTDVYRSSGNVGIGTANPTGTLSVLGSFTLRDADPNASQGKVFALEESPALEPNGLFSGAIGFRVHAAYPYVGGQSNGPRVNVLKYDGNTLLATDVNGGPRGNVGIGTITPNQRLTIRNGFSLMGADPVTSDGKLVEFAEINSSSPPTGAGGFRMTSAYPYAAGYRSGPSVNVIQYDGNTILNTDVNGNPAPGRVGIGTTTPAATLDVAGTARAQVIEITGGDVAERFPIAETAEPGTVLAIDQTCPGRLQVCREPMSRNVAGVVSGAGDLHAGVPLGGASAKDQGTPVALSGRVWVKADATERPIHVGDLLITARLPGYAAAAADPVNAAGRILGKAMSSLEHGKGLVLTLVSLQ